MKKLAVALSLLTSLPALAITRTVECNSSANGDGYLTIQLRGGTANIYECELHPCSASDDPVEKAVLTGPEAGPQTLEYRVISGHSPAERTLTIRFPERDGDPVELLIDGHESDYSCR